MVHAIEQCHKLLVYDGVHVQERIKTVDRAAEQVDLAVSEALRRRRPVLIEVRHSLPCCHPASLRYMWSTCHTAQCLVKPWYLAAMAHTGSTHACSAYNLTVLQVACNLAGLTHPSLAPSPVPGSLQPKTSNQ